MYTYIRWGFQKLSFMDFSKSKHNFVVAVLIIDSKVENFLPTTSCHSFRSFLLIPSWRRRDASVALS